MIIFSVDLSNEQLLFHQ